jgi:hypothetical protein
MTSAGMVGGWRGGRDWQVGDWQGGIWRRGMGGSLNVGLALVGWEV